MEVENNQLQPLKTFVGIVVAFIGYFAILSFSNAFIFFSIKYLFVASFSLSKFSFEEVMSVEPINLIK